MLQWLPYILVLLVLLLIRLIWEDWRFLRGDGVQVQGFVAGHGSRHSSNGSDATHGRYSMQYFAVYHFTTPEGVAMEVEDPASSSNPYDLPQTGEPVTLFYLPGSPERAAPYSLMRRLPIYGVLTMMGVMITGVWQQWF